MLFQGFARKSNSFAKSAVKHLNKSNKASFLKSSQQFRFASTSSVITNNNNNNSIINDSNNVNQYKTNYFNSLSVKGINTQALGLNQQVFLIAPDDDDA
ncbi:hypothetical protein ABK040_003252 [Willaertia magna]